MVKKATEIDSIKNQIEKVKNQRISKLIDIVVKIANDSSKSQALGVYLKEKKT